MTVTLPWPSYLPPLIRKTVKRKAPARLSGDASLLATYKQHPGMVVVREGLSTYYYRTAYDAVGHHPRRYPLPVVIR